ncbi:MAG: PIN domain-containing protein [Kiritimatiellae bacterium]|nr:PIN domain-containing protein [Kiritimatiellia bacterium]
MREAGRTFLDTNVLVYSADRHAPAKQQRTRDLLRVLAKRGAGVISTQVLQEFYVVATKKLGIDPVLAKNMLNTFGAMERVLVDFDLIKEAVDCSILEPLSFWDALIVVSAEKANCREIWTEDLNDGQVIRGVRIRNPFK